LVKMMKEFYKVNEGNDLGIFEKRLDVTPNENVSYLGKLTYHVADSTVHCFDYGMKAMIIARTKEQIEESKSLLEELTKCELTLTTRKSEY
jgi:hypothetical protein